MWGTPSKCLLLLLLLLLPVATMMTTMTDGNRVAEKKGQKETYLLCTRKPTVESGALVLKALHKKLKQGLLTRTKM